MVVTGGANVYVAEVEAALTSHPDVADAVVIGLKDPEWSRRVHALIQLRPGRGRRGDGGGPFLPIARSGWPATRRRAAMKSLTTLAGPDAGKVSRQALAKAREKDAE